MTRSVVIRLDDGSYRELPQRANRKHQRPDLTYDDDAAAAIQASLDEMAESTKPVMPEPYGPTSYGEYDVFDGLPLPEAYR